MPTSTNNVIIGPDETAMQLSQAGHAFNAEAYDNFIPSVRTPIIDGSGGTQLQNWPGGKLIVRSASGNGLMFMGGIGQHAPYSGRGLSLYGGETVTVPIKNANRISFMASISGQFIEYGMFITADTSQISVDLSGIYRTPANATPPIISGVQPVSGISGVQHNALISATFSDQMDSMCMNTSTFTVRLSGAGQPLVSGNVFVNPVDDTNAIFVPSSGQISGSLIYVARIAGGVSGVCDLDGNMMVASAAWHWTTLSTPPPADTTLPNISGTTPVSGAINVPVSDNVITVFSKDMDTTSISDANMFVSVSGNKVPASINLMANKRSVEINPVTDLDYVKIYTLNVLSGIKDTVGNSFSGSRLVPFTTAEPAWNTPYVVALNENSSFLDHDRFRVGTRMTNSSPYPLSGRNIQKVRVYLSKFSESDSIISDASGGRVVIRDTDDTLLGIYGHFNPADVPSVQPTAYEFVNTDISAVLQENRKILVEYISGNATNYIRVHRVPSNQFVGAGAVAYDGATYSGATYTLLNNLELCGILYSTN